MNIEIPTLHSIPQEIIDKLVASTKEKLPNVDDAVIKDIITTHIQIVEEYLKSQPKQ